MLAAALAAWSLPSLGVAFRAASPQAMGWDPTALCDGHSADSRAKWCMENLGLSEEAARHRVMGEFPAVFSSAAAWDAEADCDGIAAGSRAKWCMENLGLSDQAARERVMGEFPAVFSKLSRWDPEAICDGHSAASRAKWCVENLALSESAARDRVMAEFPIAFGGGGADAGGAAALGCASGAALKLVTVDPADPGCLVWADEFDYTGPPDPAKWGYDVGGHGWGNNELQHYTDRLDNAWVADGVLRIRAVREDFGEKGYTSARLMTKNKGDWLYGRVEVRMKLPTGRGTWAAAWMLPTDWEFGDWPKSGEIDIMEHVGYDVGKVHGTVHTEKFNHMKCTQVGRVLPVDVAEWHTYAVEWSPDRIQFIIDGQQYHEFSNGKCWEAWPFDRRFHVLLNLAVGGDWGGQKGVDEEAFRGEGQVMEVSSVRVYRLK